MDTNSYEIDRKFFLKLNPTRDASDYENYFFVHQGCKILADKICRVIPKWLAEVGDIQIDFSDLRHVLVAFSRQVHNTNAQKHFHSVMDRQAGHSTETAERHYALSTHDLRELSSNAIMCFFHASSAWHEFFGFSTRFTTTQLPIRIPTPVVDRVCADYHEQSATETILQNQASFLNELRASFVENTQVGVSIFRDSALVNRQIQSMALQRSDILNAVVSFNMNRQRKLQNDVELELMAIFRKATFKSPEQERGCYAVLQRKSNICGVIPTGGGKTLWFLLPARMEKDKATIVVVPLVSLLQQHYDTARGYLVNVLIWKKGYTIDVDNLPNLVILSSECACSNEGIQMLLRLESMQKLARIVFDEAHVLHDWGWRTSMSELKNLRVLAVPFLLLSATLPSYTMPFYNQFFTREFNVIRSPSTRRDIKVSVRRVPLQSGDPMDLTMQNTFEIVKENFEGASQDDRVIIYCLSFEEVRELQKKFASFWPEIGTSCYISTMSDEEKTDSVHQWRIGVSRIIIATTAFALGVDYSSVRLVVMNCGAFSISDLVQCIGRVGRDGLGGQAIVVIAEGALDYLKQKVIGAADKQEWKFLDAFLKSDVCRQWVLSTIMDDFQATCMNDASGTWVKCDSCQSRHELEKEALWGDEYFMDIDTDEVLNFLFSIEMN